MSQPINRSPSVLGTNTPRLVVATFVPLRYSAAMPVLVLYVKANADKCFDVSRPGAEERSHAR